MLRILFFPITLVAEFTRLVLSLTGRAIGFFLGLALTVLGGALCATIIGALLGLPLLGCGLSMMFHCFW